jgi:hypothetical protein
MPLLPRALGLALALTAAHQAPRPLLDRCALAADPVVSAEFSGRLREISGLAVGPGGVLLAHGDETGVITALDPATLKPQREIQLRGTPRDDFEGIAALGDTVALMTSTGRLYFLRIGAAAIASYTVMETGLGRTCELEGLGWNGRTGTLYLPCKRPKGRGPAPKELRIFRYTLGPPRAALPPIVVQGDIGNLRATAVEVDRASGHLVVLSSDPAMLVEIDTTGRVVSRKALAGKGHPQAEGLALAPGALWVADEGGGKQGKLVKYACQ